MYTLAKDITYAEKFAAETARTGLMSTQPFYAHYFYSQMREVPTRDIETAATDGRTIFYNPAYLASLKAAEAVFVFAHEVDHVICRHPQRSMHYRKEGNVQGKPYDASHCNVAMDYCVNAGLMQQGVGMMNPSWLYDPNTTAEDLWEDVYVRTYKDRKPGGGGTTFGGSGRAPRGAKGDKTADGAGGSFDQVLDPPIDPVTGRVDVPDPAEFKEAIARAAAAAKAMGSLPGRIQRIVDDILEPQIDWREHVRLLITGKIGDRRETWDRPNRRRLALNPLIITPGRAGHGADTVACVVDNSGSISEKEMAAYFTEIGAVLADVRPKRVVLIWCDAKVQQVDIANSLDDMIDIRVKGSPGGGGTSFRPPFIYLEDEGIVPDTLIYLTDMCGGFPDKAPAYPVVWCATTDAEAPWGDTVRVKV